MMKADDFLNWMEKAKCSSAIDVVRVLGVGRNQAQQWVASAKAGDDVEVKLTVALAMSARAHQLNRWPD